MQSVQRGEVFGASPLSCRHHGRHGGVSPSCVTSSMTADGMALFLPSGYLGSDVDGRSPGVPLVPQTGSCSPSLSLISHELSTASAVHCPQTSTDCSGWRGRARVSLVGPVDCAERRRFITSPPRDCPFRCGSFRRCTEEDEALTVGRNERGFGCDSQGCQHLQRTRPGVEKKHKETLVQPVAAKTEERDSWRKPWSSDRYASSLRHFPTVAGALLSMPRRRIRSVLSVKMQAWTASWLRPRESCELTRMGLIRSERLDTRALEGNSSCWVVPAFGGQPLGAGSALRSVSLFTVGSEDHPAPASAYRASVRSGVHERSARFVRSSHVSWTRGPFRSFFSSVDTFEDRRENATEESCSSAPGCCGTSLHSKSKDTTPVHDGDLSQVRSRGTRERVPVLPPASATQYFDGSCSNTELNNERTRRKSVMMSAVTGVQGPAALPKDGHSPPGHSPPSRAHTLRSDLRQRSVLSSTPVELLDAPQSGGLDCESRGEDNPTCLSNQARFSVRRDEAGTAGEPTLSSTWGYQCEDQHSASRPDVSMEDESDGGSPDGAWSRNDASVARRPPAGLALASRPESLLSCQGEAGGHARARTQNSTLLTRGEMFPGVRNSTYHCPDKKKDDHSLAEEAASGSVHRRPRTVEPGRMRECSAPANALLPGQSPIPNARDGVTRASPGGCEELGNFEAEKPGSREPRKGVLRHLLEDAVSLLEAFEASRTEKTESSTRSIEVIQKEIFRVHEHMAGHLPSASAAEVRGVWW